MKQILLTTTLVLLAGVGIARGETITIDSIEDGWTGAVGGTGVVYSNKPNPGYDSVKWGTNIGNGKSAYYWNSRDTTFSVDTNKVFYLGTFTHDNHVIGLGSSITSVNLDFTLGFAGAPTTLSATFLFKHLETPNATPCGLESVTVCDDVVTLANASFNQQIWYGGQTYYFSLLGFSAGSVPPEDYLQTAEGKKTSANLYAIITDAPIGVPDGGATLALLGGALMGLGVLRRRLGA